MKKAVPLAACTLRCCLLPWRGVLSRRVMEPLDSSSPPQPSCLAEVWFDVSVLPMRKFCAFGASPRDIGAQLCHCQGERHGGPSGECVRFFG